LEQMLNDKRILEEEERQKLKAEMERKELER
jgi:hypothetical protein